MKPQCRQTLPHVCAKMSLRSVTRVMKDNLHVYVESLDRQVFLFASLTRSDVLKV